MAAEKGDDLMCVSDQESYCDKLQHPTSIKRCDSGFVDGRLENSVNGRSNKLKTLEEEEATKRELKHQPYFRERSQSDPGFYSLPSGDITTQESIEMEIERKKAILLFEDDGSIAIIEVQTKRMATDCGECSGCSYKADPLSFYTYISGKMMTLEAALSPHSERGPDPVRLVPVTGPPSQDETFLQVNVAGKPGEGTTGELKSVAGAYVALRVDSSDSRVAHLETYNKETFMKLLSSGDKYTLATLTILRCNMCNKWHQVAMYYSSKNFDYCYFVMPSSGNKVKIQVVKKEMVSNDSDAYAMYRQWMEVPYSTSSNV